MTSRHPADAALARAAWRLVPLAMAMYVASYLDRVNVGFAALTMNKDLGFSPEVYGFGSGILFLGYSLFDVPSNLIMEKVGARLWMCRIMLTWGLVSIATAFVTGATGFFTIRFILGLAEAGFVPGILLYFTYWFPAATRTRIMALFFMGAALSSAIGSPISSYFLSIDAFGLHGWQWMFIAEGIPTLLLGIIVLLWMPDRPATAKWLTSGDKQLIAARLAEDPKPERHSFRAMLSDWRIWVLIPADFCIAFALFSLGLWLPQMVKALGYDNAHTGWIVMIPYAVAMVVSWGIGWSSDRSGKPVLHVVLSTLLAAAGFCVAAIARTDVGVIFGFSLAASGAIAGLATFWTVPPLFLGGTAAAGGLALIASFGNLSGFVGPYAVGWLKQQSGGYHSGMWLCALTQLFAAMLVLWLGRSLKAKV
jgi:ACS family tartrate transporter-like MFS transporter